MAEDIQAAMLVLAQPHELAVRMHPDLGGASVINARNVEAYVYPHREGGFVADVWRPGAADATQNRMQDLSACIAFAVQSVA